ncbi:MAG: zinc ribbon domain-containing protein [Methylohalobius sp.]|nr:zinc ribbon domain-containing protein [Methylohalobius sp.]
MPTYDYLCRVNQKIVEVRHGMNETIRTWGELCRLAGIDPGSTPPDAPVEKLITGGNVISSNSLKNPEPCGAGTCGMGACGGGTCALDDF